jgi:hypothetical protein
MIQCNPHGGCSSMAEHLTVDQGVVGSTPISHPKREDCSFQSSLFINEYCPGMSRIGIYPLMAEHLTVDQGVWVQNLLATYPRLCKYTIPPN